MYNYGVNYSDEDLLQLSGLQHFEFCRRQWALIHIEHQWNENWRTVDGEFFHHRAHDAEARERRGDILIIRGLAVKSFRLGITGQCDIVEFHQNPDGVPLFGEEGCWIPYPVEYKRGKPKQNRADVLQLCAQALCLEEMLCCHIKEGALFYGETKHRLAVEFDEEIRQDVESRLLEMHRYYERGYTPKVKPGKFCKECSLKEQCLPDICNRDHSHCYLQNALEEET